MSRSWMLLLCFTWACTDRGPIEVRDDDDDVSDDDDYVSDDDDAAPRRCNGSTVLCDRPLTEVVLPGTHNSMSNAADGWWVPNQNTGIEAQLADGIRGLLLDTHDYAGEPHLCHSNCLLGSRPLVDALEGIDEFLRSNPDEVVAIIFQDGISAESTASVFEASGLIDHVYTHAGAAWPTLGEMIDAGTRLLVTAEFSGPPPAWYHHAWDLFSDSPYSFGSTDDFSCELNRGSAANDLFLVNHWIGNPLSNEAASRGANAADVLRSRVTECEEERGRLPTLIAVDHHDVGDLLEVVAELNAR